MANEITVTARLQATKGYLKVDRNPGTQAITMTGTRKDAGVQDIGFAAHELVVVAAEFGTAGWAFFRNLDTTNFVQIGVDVGTTFYPVIKLLAGEACVVPLATDVLYAKADTASVSLEYELLER